MLGSWLDERTQEFRDTVNIVAMDGFTGYATAVDKHLAHASELMDPFHVVHLGLDKLTGCRQRIQQAIFGRRGRSGDPLYGARRTLMTGAPLLTGFQYNKLVALYADERYLPVQVTWSCVQEIMAAYKHPDKRQGKSIMAGGIKVLSTGVPSELKELRTLSNTLKRRRKDILAFFDVGVSHGPVEAAGGRLEHLHGIAIGFEGP